jgi:ferric-dicitrate binding protein FerR (iron transport regulator)
MRGDRQGCVLDRLVESLRAAMSKNLNSARAMREALQWFDRLNTNEVKLETLSKFSNWRADPENRNAYDEVSKAYYTDRDVRPRVRPTFH